MSENLYTLRIRLKWAKGVWREIEILGTQTLEDLHYAILDAFEWSNDDPYQVINSDDVDNLDYIYEPNSTTEGRVAEATILDVLELEEGDTFFYVYGNMRNEFRIKVMIVDDPDPYGDYPDIVDENGDSPDQSGAYL